MPLYVRAGSIVPMGPDDGMVDREAGRPDRTARLSRERTATFTLYEDENDNYDYEKGAHATIPFHWDDAAKKLTIGEREGEFPGMLEQRTFQIVFVDENHGTGIELSQRADKVVKYSGKGISVSR